MSDINYDAHTLIAVLTKKKKKHPQMTSILQNYDILTNENLEHRQID